MQLSAALLAQYGTELPWPVNPATLVMVTTFPLLAFRCGIVARVQ